MMNNIRTLPVSKINLTPTELLREMLAQAESDPTSINNLVILYSNEGSNLKKRFSMDLRMDVAVFLLELAKTELLNRG